MSRATDPDDLLPIPPEVRGNEVCFEILDGRWVEMPPRSVYSAVTASRIATRLGTFAEAHDLGAATCQMLFHLPLPGDRNRRPAAAFVSYQRWPKRRPLSPYAHAWDVVPELAVEVVSPTDVAEDLLEKVDEYFQANAQLVWVVYPRRRLVYVYESTTTIRVLAAGEALDGGGVLPGFRLPLAEVFQEPAPPNGE